MSTLSYKNDEDTDRLNPAVELSHRENAGNVGANDQQSAYDRDFESMTSPENYARDGREGELARQNQQTVADAESNPNAMNYTGNGAKSTKQKFDLKTFLKKKGPIGGIAGLLLGGAGLLSFFGGPGLLIVHVSEVLTEKLNFQLASMDDRTVKVLKAKFENSTTGVCTTAINFRCKLASFSDNEVKNFKKAGIEMVDEKKTVLGRTKPTKLKFEGKEISAKDFSKTLKTNPSFAKAIVAGYNPKFAGLSDSAWSKVAGKLGVSKKAPFEEADKTDEARQKRVQEASNNPADSSTASAPNECDGKECTDEEKKAADEKQKAANSANEFGKSAEEVVKDDIKKSTGVIGAASKALKAGKNAVSVEGAISDGCTAFGMFNLASKGAKVIRAAQMARYAMVFLTTASMIKSGDARADDVNYLGNTLTKVVKNDDGTLSKAATDSFGYRNAAYGDTGADDSVTPYLAGGGLGGTFASVSATILKIIGVGDVKRGREVCKIDNNIAVQAVGFVAGIALWIVPGGQPIQASKVVAQIAIAAAVAAATAVLPSILIDLASGKLVDKNTYGESSGNIMAAGTGSMLSDVAAAGGNGLLSPEDAVAYQQMNDTIVAKYSDLEGDSSDPLDASNPHTFVGAIYSKLVPYVSSFSSISNAISSSTSIVGSSLTNITSPGAKALTAKDYQKCQDYDIQESGAAANEMCVIIRGIPPKYLGDDPQTVQDRLEKSGDVDPEFGEPISESYRHIVDICMDRSGEEVDTEECVIKSQHTADLFIHYVDLRVMKGLETYGTTSYGGLNVMTYNILGGGHDNGGGETVKERLNQLITTVRAKQPSIIGFQEVNYGTGQRGGLHDGLNDIYDGGPYDDKGTASSRPIYWKRGEFTKIDGGIYTYPRYDEKEAEYPWVKLQSTNGPTIYVFNTHNSTGDESTRTVGGLGGKEQRKLAAEKELEAINNIVTDGSPVILTGDFNSLCTPRARDGNYGPDKLPCGIFAADPKFQFQDAGETAYRTGKQTINWEYDTSHGEAGSLDERKSGKEGQHIDHVFFSTGIQVNSWENVIDENTKNASDHTPVIANLYVPGLYRGQPSTNTSQTGSDIGTDDYKTECKRYTDCTRWCVDFVLFRLLKHGVKLSTHKLGDGGYVVGTLGRMGYKVDTTPAVHSVMSTFATSQPTVGHTAMVSQVNADGSIVVEEYNYTHSMAYDKRTVSAAEIKSKKMTFAHTEVDYK